MAGRPSASARFQSHTLRNGGLHQVRDLPHFAGEVQGFDEEAAAAGVGQHLRGELGHDLAGRDQVAGGPGFAGVGAEAILKQAGIAQHAGEQIVEIVSDAAGEHTEALEALVLLDVRFESLALADVGGHHHDAIEAGCLGKGRGGPDMQMEGLPLDVADQLRGGHGLAAAGAFGERAALRDCEAGAWRRRRRSICARCHRD